MLRVRFNLSESSSVFTLNNRKNGEVKKVIVDTDVGTDVDDLWTLAVAVSRHDVDLAAVTVVYGDVGLRARLASLALTGMGVSVPVARGIGDPMSGKEVMWAGFEGVGVPGLDDADSGTDDAADLLCSLTAADPGNIDVVAIGPLTNIAAAIKQDPSFVSNVSQLTIMGGEFEREWAEHNVSSDVVASRIVFDSGISLTIMPLDQTLRVMLTEEDLLPITESHLIGGLLADQADRFWSWLQACIPKAPRQKSPAHDPCALLTVVEPELFEFTPMAVTVDDQGRTSGNPDAQSPINVVTDLDVGRVHEAILTALHP